jgi:predicted cupin superfamily sugar epimerase
VSADRVTELIEKLGLRPHPEGGYYREIFRSPSQVAPADGRAARSALTTIYFLLPQGSQSRWHQVQSDEVWHLYEGGPLELLELSQGVTDLVLHQLATISTGSDAPVHTVAARNWQAARAIANYALVGCTVAPGFEFADFRMLADDADLAATVRANWPELADLI